jgi:hypothetical protein
MQLAKDRFGKDRIGFSGTMPRALAELEFAMHTYFEHLYTHLPIAVTLDHFEAFLPWNVKHQPNDHEAAEGRS